MQRREVTICVFMLVFGSILSVSPFRAFNGTTANRGLFITNLRIFIAAAFGFGLVNSVDDQEDITRLRTDPKEWERSAVWQKLWGSATMAASQKLQWKSPEYVDDIAIQSIMRVIRKLPLYPDIHKFHELRAFTARIAKDLSISHLRKLLGPEQGGGKFDVFDDEKHDREEEPFLADKYLFKERTYLILKMLNKLMPLNRKLLNDFFLHGMKQKEIADKYDMPIGTVGVYIQRALKEARGCLEYDKMLLDDIRSTLHMVILVLIFLSIR